MAERFGVVVAIGLTFFGLMLIASQDIDVGLNFGGGEQQQQVQVVSESFGELGGATQDVRTSQIGTFNIGEGLGDIQAYQRERKTLSNAMFSKEAINFNYNATEPRYAVIDFEVLGTEGSGALYVKVNNERIFERSLVSSADETVNISSEYLNNGVNDFEIGVNKGGLLGSTEYVIEDIEASVRDRKFNDRTENFQMYDYELRDFVGANISFNIPVDSSIVTEPLEVEVNDNEVFSEASVRAEQDISITPSNADLRPGANTVRFSTDADASYLIENAQLAVRYIGTTQTIQRNVNFELTQDDLSYVNREDTQETLSFDYQALSGQGDVEFSINDYNVSMNPSNGENSHELPEEVFEDENTLKLTGSGSFVLNNLVISSEVEDK